MYDYVGKFIIIVIIINLNVTYYQNLWKLVISEMICASLELQILDKERSGFDFHSHDPQIAFRVG